jgi:enoyl-CoA hydratase/carnithine racemase
MEEHLSAASGELLARVANGVATVTLNRPAALNALSLGMLEGLAGWLDRWEHDGRVAKVVLRGAGQKAFCAGGDIRALRDSIESGDTMHEEFMRIEYALDYRIHTYPKPIAALIDGVVMGGGMGIAQGCALRIAGDRTKMAMPETIIGLFPDVGGSFFLSRVPGELGTYLGLVGPTIGAADAIYCGLADVNVGEEREPGLAALREPIDRHFAHDSIEAIADSLRREAGPHAEWAKRTLEALSARSPTMLAVTLEQLRRGRALTLAECFRMELNLVHGAFAHGDLVEGVRAMIIEKDRNPRWSPRAPLEAFFRPRWSAAQHPLAGLS